MPYQPAVSDVHIDAALTNFATAYMQDAGNFIADKVFPTVPVQNKSDKYFKFAKDAFLRSGGQKTPYGIEAPRGGLNISNDSYQCDIYRWAFDVTPDVRANADSAISVDTMASNFVMNSLLILREVTWASSYFTTGKWGLDLTGSATTSDATHFIQWDNQALSNPISDIKAQKTRILQTTGYEPNTLVVSQFVHDALVQHPLILDRYKYTSSDSITPEMLARLFEVKNYYIAKAVQVTSQEGQTITTDFVMGKNALLCYVPPAPGIMVVASGTIFVWKGLTGLNDLAVRVSRIPMNWLGIGTERVEGEYAWGMKLIGSDLGTFFASAVS